MLEVADCELEVPLLIVAVYVMLLVAEFVALYQVTVTVSPDGNVRTVPPVADVPLGDPYQVQYDGFPLLKYGAVTIDTVFPDLDIDPGASVVTSVTEAKSPDLTVYVDPDPPPVGDDHDCDMLPVGDP